jgi:hypothetical protein
MYGAKIFVNAGCREVNENLSDVSSALDLKSLALDAPCAGCHRRWSGDSRAATVTRCGEGELVDNYLRLRCLRRDGRKGDIPRTAAKTRLRRKLAGWLLLS